MDDFIFIGKIVNTHGIKGELRLISDFDYKEKVFTKNFIIYIGGYSEEHEITSYRPHKQFDMITLKGYNDINQVLKYKNQKVYVKRASLNLNDEYLLQDLIGLDVYYKNIFYGTISDIINNNSNILLQVKGENNFYIPKNDNFIKAVDVKTKRIDVENIEGLIIWE